MDALQMALQLKVGSIVEVAFNDGPNLCGIITNIDAADQKKFIKKGRGLFYMTALFDMRVHNCAMQAISFSNEQVFFVAPVQPDFKAVIDEAKNASMRWTLTYEGSESDPLNFEDATTDDDALSMKEADKAILKTMRLGQEFKLNAEEEWIAKRVA